MKKIVLGLILSVFLIGGCKPIEVVKFVDRWHENTKIDTINTIQRDSILIRLRNDTVFVEKYKTLLKERIKIVNNTDSFLKIDTIVKEIKLPAKEIVKYKWGLFDWIGLIFCIYIAIKIFLRLYKPL